MEMYEMLSQGRGDSAFPLTWLKWQSQIKFFQMNLRVTARLTAVTGSKKRTQILAYIFIHKWALPGQGTRQKEIRSGVTKPMLDVHSSLSPLGILFITSRNISKREMLVCIAVRWNLNFRTKMGNGLFKETLGVNIRRINEYYMLFLLA